MTKTFAKAQFKNRAYFMFRRIYGPKYENGEWKNRTNREQDEKAKERI